MGTVNLNQGYFLAFSLESILWGAHVVIFILALIILANNRKRRTINRFLFVSMIILFIFCTTHYSLIFNNVYQGLMRKHYDIGIEDNFLVGADLMIFITDCTGQMVLIYRCWLVWGKRWYIVVLPILMSLTSLSCGISALGLLLHIDPNAAVAPPAVYRNAEVALGLPLGTNILVTSLIIGRIWYLTRHTPDLLPSRTILAAVAVVVESGALVVVAQLASCVLFVLNHPGQNIATCSAVQCYGIAPTLIMLRVGTGNSIESSMKTNVTTVNFVDPTSGSYATEKHQNRTGSYGAETGLSTIGVDTKTEKTEAS